MAVQCFFIEPTNRQRRFARCFADGKCAKSKYGYHDVMTYVDTVNARIVNDGNRRHYAPVRRLSAKAGWPKRCACGFKFEKKHRQTFSDVIYRRTDTGAKLSLRDAPPGAMWDAWWMPDCWKGSDGRCLCVICPNGSHWMIDGRASNCTMPNDKIHRCWCRHGEPPNITVDKNGNTCAAGAGSIQAGDYHGFLRGGIFT